MPVTPGRSYHEKVNPAPDGSVAAYDGACPPEAALLDPGEFQAAFSSCGISNGDLNADTLIDISDVEPFATELLLPE